MPKKAKSKKNDQKPTRFQPYRRCAPREPCFPQFLQLPRELRDQVYSHLLTMPGAIDVGKVWNDLPRIPTSIFLTSRQVYEESSSCFYGGNTFCFLEVCDDFQEDNDDVSENRLVSWLAKIGRANKLCVRRLQLRMRDERDVEYYETLLRRMARELPNVKRLGLLMERHHVTRRLLHPGHEIASWNPNYVVPIDEDKIPRLYSALKSLSLKLVTLADFRTQLEFVETLPPHFQCQVNAVELKAVERREYDCVSMFEQKQWFISPAASYNREIRGKILENSDLTDQTAFSPAKRGRKDQRDSSSGAKDLTEGRDSEDLDMNEGVV